MDEKYFYLDSVGQQKGPIGINELGRFDITPTTMVWKQGLAEWVQAKTLPEFQAYFAASGTQNDTQTPPPPQQPQTAPPFTSYEVKPDNYLVWAILSTVLCCLPFGIVSIVYSSKVDNLWALGNKAQAIEAANNAKKWAIIGAISGAVVGIIYAIVVAMTAACNSF